MEPHGGPVSGVDRRAIFLSLKARDSSSRVVVHAQQPWDCDEIPWRDKIPGCCCVEMASVGLHQFAEKAIEPSKRCSW